MSSQKILERWKTWRNLLKVSDQSHKTFFALYFLASQVHLAFIPARGIPGKVIKLSVRTIENVLIFTHTHTHTFIYAYHIHIYTHICIYLDVHIHIHTQGNTKGVSITVLLTSCLTGLELAVWQLTNFVFICKTD